MGEFGRLCPACRMKNGLHSLDQSCPSACFGAKNHRMHAGSRRLSERSCCVSQTCLLGASANPQLRKTPPSNIETVGWVAGQLNVRLAECQVGLAAGWTAGWLDSWPAEQLAGWIAGWVDLQTKVIVLAYYCQSF